MKTNLTKTLENISYEPAEEIAKKYKAAAQNMDEGFQARIYSKTMVIISDSDSKSGTNS